MSEPFIGQISCFGFNFPPRGWAACAGQLLPIRQYTALFSLLGIQFGGDGQVTFGLPNLQAVTPIGAGQGPGLSLYNMGETDGVAAVTLPLSQTPLHNHGFTATASAATAAVPTSGMALAQGTTPGTRGSPGTPIPSFAPATVGTATTLSQSVLTPFTGGNAPHNNVQPTQVANWCISLEGVFPSRP